MLTYPAELATHDLEVCAIYNFGLKPDINLL